jgi:dTDP-glucose pyrophosphorylase
MASTFTKGWKKSIVTPGQTIRDALGAISASGSLLACVVDQNGVLIGILSDSDLRKALLNGGDIDDPISRWMNTNPVVANTEHSLAEIQSIVSSFGVRELPIVDRQGVVQDIFTLGIHDGIERSVADRNFCTTPKLAIHSPCAMMILAGGLGTRLRPVISDRPKSLAIVGNKPVLETIIYRAAAEGVKKFYISVNYMADQIERHLEAPSYKDLDITVIHENTRMGTAGSLSLIPEKLTTPLIVVNSDVLTTASLAKLLNRHSSQGSFATCAVRPYSFKVPFGVCEIENLCVTKITEKPELSVLVNAGLYVLSPDAVESIPKGKYFDMPDLLSKSLQLGKVITPFYVHEYWIDIGKPEDFARANNDFEMHFGIGQ